MPATLRIAVVYPDLLGTYGDGGNGLILARRAEWRGLAAELLQATSDAALPEADIYCLGGGEDGPQVRAARALIDDGTLTRRAASGAVVLAVCAGYQIVGHDFPGADGTSHPGVGLLGVTTAKGDGPRCVGEVTAEPTPEVLALLAPIALPTLTGFENHGGRTTLHEGVTALARVTHGVGNGDGDGDGDGDDGVGGTEGALCGRVVGTYLHGPVLARNPTLADRLLSWATETDVAPLADEAEHALRQERLAATGRRLRGRTRRKKTSR